MEALRAFFISEKFRSTRTVRSNGSGEVGGVLDITPVRLGFLIINKGLSINVNHNYRFSIKLFHDADQYSLIVSL